MEIPEFKHKSEKEEWVKLDKGQLPKDEIVITIKGSKKIDNISIYFKED